MSLRLAPCELNDPGHFDLFFPKTENVAQDLGGSYRLARFRLQGRLQMLRIGQFDINYHIL